MTNKLISYSLKVKNLKDSEGINPLMLQRSFKANLFSQLLYKEERKAIAYSYSFKETWSNKDKKIIKKLN